MVGRKFVARHGDSTFEVDYDADDGFEVFKFQLFSLTSIPPDEQKILGRDGGGDRVISDDSDLARIYDELILLSINDEDRTRQHESTTGTGAVAQNNANFLISDEELARKLQWLRRGNLEYSDADINEFRIDFAKYFMKRQSS